MKRYLPNRPGRLLALLGAFLVFAAAGWSANNRVWVQYAPGAKGPVMAALAKAGGHVHYEFDNIDAVAVTLPERALAGISHNPNVALVEADPIRVMSSETVPYGIDLVQSFDAQASGGDGHGMIVGVIDSGVYRDHEDLPFSKLSGYPDYGANDERTWYRDFDSHGTHVVGTIAAVGNNGKGVVGVAPGIDQIYMVKVFGDTGNWVYSSGLLAAVQYAVNTGHAKIISMSLGGAGKSKTEERGLNSLYNSGTLLIAAAGNAGDTSTSYPAGYSSVVSVAAIDEQLNVADFSQQNNTVELAAPGVAVLSSVSYIDSTSASVGASTYPARLVEFAPRLNRSGTVVDGGLGTSTNPAWNGKIVFVRRGDISFYDKVHNVQLSGGIACIIANNEPGELYATLGEGNSSTIPAVGITQAAGDSILAAITPSGASGGVDTTFTQPASGYDLFDGTSMATPHVSGVAALAWSKYPAATNKQVRQALDDSAADLGAAGRDNAFGYGLVQADAAITELGQILGGGGGGGDDTTPPGIGTITTATAKGKPGGFTVSFTTTEAATTVVTIPGLGTKTTSLGTSHSVKFQGSTNTTYSGTVTATDAAGNQSAPKPFARDN